MAAKFVMTTLVRLSLAGLLALTSLFLFFTEPASAG
jgi:hypothetical protein